MGDLTLLLITVTMSTNAVKLTKRLTFILGQNISGILYVFAKAK
jgi:hypothetical protein